MENALDEYMAYPFDTDETYQVSIITNFKRIHHNKGRSKV